MNRTRAISIAVAPLALVAIAACFSSSSGSGAGSGGSSGSGSGSGGSSGSSSGSGSGGGSGGSSGSASSSGGGSGSGSGGGSGSSSGGNGGTQLASGLSGIQSLIVAGSSLAWIDYGTKSIMTVPIAGGSMPKVVFTDANLDVDIAWDGTSIFFFRTIGGTSELDSIGLDGSGKKTLSSGINYSPISGKVSELFIAGGNVYFAGWVVTDAGASFGAILSVPTTGGPWSIAVQGTGAAYWGFNSTNLIWADSSGAYFNYVPVNGGGKLLTGYATLGGTPTVLTGVDNPISGNFTVLNGAAYYTDDTITGGFTAKLQKVTPGGAPSTVATYTGEEGTTLAADSSGMFMLATGMANGIYRVDPTSGVQTAFDSANNALDTAVFALDSKNLYFVEGAGGKYSIWSKAR